MTDSGSIVRLFVGGLPADITIKQLEARFAPFGTLSRVELIPSKLPKGPSACRGFAYVDFRPEDDQALHRCLSLVRSYATTLVKMVNKEACQVSTKPVCHAKFLQSKSACSITGVNGLVECYELKKLESIT